MMRRLAPESLRDVRRFGTPQPSQGDPSDLYRAQRAHLTRLLLAELARAPAGIVDTVAEALARVRDARETRLRVHPEDRILLPTADQLCARHGLRGVLTLLEDATLTRGGCVLQSTDGTLDARVETRVGRLLAAAEAFA